MTGEYIGIGRFSAAFMPEFICRMEEMIDRQEHGVWWENVVYSMTGQQPVYVEDVSGHFWADPLVLLQYVTDYQVDKEQVIKVLFQEGVPLKKEVKGLTYAVVDSILRRKGSSVPQEEKSPADEATPHHKPNSAEQADTPAMMEDAAPVDGEDVLAKVFKWHVEKPEVRFIHVGLLKLQRKNNEETYRIAWKCYGENIPEAFGRSVRFQWGKFLDFAEQRGMARAMLNRMIS